MERVFSRINWENEPSTATPIDEDNLNKIDYALYEIDGRVIENRRLIEGLQEYETRAAESAAAAELSASEALASQQAAAISENNAKTSENNAKDSEDAALLSETNSKNSENAAKLSETNAKTSEDNAKASETAAATSETNAKTSETNATNSATRAGNSAIAAARSASQAETYMENAGRSADNAAESESNSEAWAVGQRGGVDVLDDDVTYKNNSKWYAKVAELFRNAVETLYNNIVDIQTEINHKLELAEFDVDDNGNLIYTDNSGYVFTVDDNGNLNWEVA